MALSDQSVIGMLLNNIITPLYKTDSESVTAPSGNQSNEVFSVACNTGLCYHHYLSSEDANNLIPDSDGFIEILVPNINSIRDEARFLLFGEEIEFSESERRSLVFKHYTEATLSVVPILFEKWYEQCGSMDAVLNEYPTFVVQYLHKLVLYPLYPQLGECGIFELSFSHYANNCSDYSECEDALLSLQNQLQEIQGQAQQVQETVRGANSSLLGTAAGTIAGNITNISQKRKAYSDKSISAKLLEAFRNTIETGIQSHINTLNNYISDYLTWSFDEGKAAGLFESAVRFPQKRDELLLQSFKSYPRNQTLLKYIFESYPDERREIVRIANNYCVEIGDAIEKVLQSQCAENLDSLPALEAARASVLSVMVDLGIDESKTLDEIEQACVTRLIDGYENSNENDCRLLISKLERYVASDKNKSPYLSALNNHILKIHTNEDRALFESILMKTDIRSADDITEAISKINSARRTDCAEEFIAALNSYNETNIRKAQAYHSSNPVIKITGSKRIWDLLTVNGTVLHPTLLEEPPYSGQLDSIKKHTVDLSERVGGRAKSLFSKGGEILKSVSSSNATTWICPKCKAKNKGKYCSECGKGRPKNM